MTATPADTPEEDAPEDDPLDDLEPADTDPTDESADGPDRRGFIVRRDVTKRLDVYLQQRLKGISRSRIQKLIELGGVKVNQTQIKASTRLRRGDRVEIILPPVAVRTIEPEPIPLHIVFEDEDLIILNKQAGLVVHPARSHLSGTLLNGLAHRFEQQQHQAGQTATPYATRGFSPTPRRRGGDVQGLSHVGAAEFRPGIVHRLDKNTTGVLVVAKNDDAHWGIARQFEERKTLKAYLALVHGNLDRPAGAIEQPVGKHPTIREAYAVRHDHTGKYALTLYRVREQYRGYSLVEVEIKTGRTHQIRVHLSYIGHPIVGDIVYGGEPVGTSDLDNPPTPAGSRSHLNYARSKEEGAALSASVQSRDDLLLAHPALHATLLRFQHPSTKLPATFTAPLHEPFAGLVRQLRARPIDAPIVDEGCLIDLNAAVPIDTTG